MAAYGALVSVMQIIDQLQTHPLPPISIDQKQVESLTEAVSSLQDFLEGYSPHGGYTADEDYWERRIAEAAYDAEDVIESYIVDQIRARSRNRVETISSAQFYQGLQKVIENMNLIKIDIKEKMVVVQNQLHIIKSVSTVAGASSSRSSSIAQKVTMVGFDDVLLQMLDKITGGGLTRQIIPIVGMGGIGKTTLARNIYVSPLVQESFDVCAWSTISQGYGAQKILRQILDQVDKGKEGDLSVDELGDHLYKYLFGRKYFIVMDDMWIIEAWDRVRRFFPDNKNGSRIVVTTRLSNLASQFNYSNGLDLKFLDEDASWDLFYKTVFVEEACPIELEDLGKKIVEGCKGLPLSIAVIGGLLSKSEQTQESWGFFEKNISSIVNLDDNESCLQVLYMSYINLPVHLKPCFLYMGVFREDKEIPIKLLILLWVAEGFVKSIDRKSLEEAAEEYVEELVDRNMLIVEKRTRCGKVKRLMMHDLLRDMCLREARKLKFLCVLEEHTIPQDIHSYRRVASRLSEYPTPLVQSLESASLVRFYYGRRLKILPYNYRLLRVCVLNQTTMMKKEMKILRRSLWGWLTCVFFWVSNDNVLDIWKVPQVRHIITRRGPLNAADCLPDPPSGKEDMVLENLQTLSYVSNLKFGEGLIKRIPNIKTLKLYYVDTSREEEEDDYCLNNLCFLHKLETLELWSATDDFHLMREVSFPHSIKKLTLFRTYLPWDDMKTKIGSLPHLQVLKLKTGSFTGCTWETSEGQFSNLKFLLIESCDLENWITDDTHFPRLEHIVLRYMSSLREIPSVIGDIPTLLSIEVERCSASTVDSAKIIEEEQGELCNEQLQILIR